MPAAPDSPVFAWDVAVLGGTLVALLWAARRAWRVARQREAMDTQLRRDAQQDHAP